MHPRDRLFPSIRESRRVRSMFQFCIVVLKLCVVARVNLHLTYHSRIVYCPNTNQSTTRHGFTFVLDRPHSISNPFFLHGIEVFESFPLALFGVVSDAILEMIEHMHREVQSISVLLQASKRLNYAHNISHTMVESMPHGRVGEGG